MHYGAYLHQHPLALAHAVKLLRRVKKHQALLLYKIRMHAVAEILSVECSRGGNDVLREVVVPLTQSVVILPVEKKEKVDVQGVEKGTREIPKVKLDDNVDLVWKRETYNQGLDYFGMGITIKGFISGLFNSNENKSEKKIEELERIEKGTETFYNYIRSADFKNVMTNDYGLTEDEFVDFVNYFQKNAGSIRKSTNEYDILKSAVEKVSSFKNTYIKNK